jgi:hypothetical protein
MGGKKVKIFTLLKTRYVGIGFLKMRLIPYINIAYRNICLKNILIIENEDN